MSRAGTPTDNGAMEAINGWVKAEMFIDFDLSHCEDVPAFVERYITFFNEERPSAALGYLTPKAYKEMSLSGKLVPKKPSKIKYEKKQKKNRGSKIRQKQISVYKTLTTANGLKEYTELSRDAVRNTELKNSILNSNAEERFKIDNILKKYNLTRNDNFKHQLSELKNDIDFFKKYSPIYLNKYSAEKTKSEFEGRIIATLDSYKIQFDNNPLVSTKTVISDVNNYNNSKQHKADLLEKKANFIKENGLEGFSSLDIDGNEEELRQAHEAKK